MLTTGFLTTGFETPSTGSLFGVATDPVPIHLDDVMCTGDERGIIDCVHRGVGVEDCGHSEDTGIKCSEFGTIFVLNILAV